MHSMKIYLLVLIAPILQVALGQQRLEIDTLYDLISTSGWIVECNYGYQQNVSDFQCGRNVRVEIPAEDLDGEEGFWTGCGEICNLKYTLRDTDAAFSVRVYLQDAHMIVVKNDVVNEYHPGTGWTNVQVDLSFTKTIGLRLVQAATGSFAVLDKIYIDPVIPTTTTTTTTPTTTTEPTTTPTTTEATTTTTPTTTTEPTTTEATTTTTPTTTTEPTTTPTTTEATTTTTPTTTTEATTTTTPTTTTEETTTTTPTTTTEATTTTTPTTTTEATTTTTTEPTTTPTTTDATTTTTPTTTTEATTTTTPTTTTTTGANKRMENSFFPYLRNLFR